MEELIIKCPHCHKETTVTADLDTYSRTRGWANIVKDDDNNCYIDWETLEIDGCWNYVCDECGEVVAGSLEEMKEKYLDKE